MSSIKTSIEALSKTADELYAKVCKVTSVDSGAKQCDVKPIDGTAAIVDVPYTVRKLGNGFTAHPKYDSLVLVVFTDKHNARICEISEPELWELIIGTATLKIDENGFVIKKGANSLQSLVAEFIDLILQMQFTTNTGTTITLVNALSFTSLQSKFNNLLKHS
jgi:hypothetical protein